MFEIKKEGKGHSIWKDGHFVMWVIGSVRNAEKEIKKL